MLLEPGPTLGAGTGAAGAQGHRPARHDGGWAAPAYGKIVGGAHEKRAVLRTALDVREPV